MNPNLTGVVLCYNEALRIEKCIRSLARVCAQVVVMDSFSTDQSLECVRNYWLESGRLPSDLILSVQEWKGFTQTRNQSLDWVQSPWVLWLDSDEWLSEELIHELESFSQNIVDKEVVYWIPRKNYFLGRWIRFGGWYPDRKARLAQTNRCEWRKGPRGADVHEDLFPRVGLRHKQSKAFLKGHILHVTFQDRKEQRETNERYSSLLAEGLVLELRKEQKGAPSLWSLYVRPLVKFIENYIWKRGFLDALPGFYIAWGSAQSLHWRLKKIRKSFVKKEGS